MKNRVLFVLLVVAMFFMAAPNVFGAPPEAAPPEAATTAAEVEKAPETTGVVEAPPAVETPVVATEGAPPATETATTGDGAPPVIANDDEALDVVRQLIDAAKNGKWGMAASLLIMLLVYAVARFGLTKYLDPRAVPWMAAGTGILSYVAGALALDGASVVDAVLGGFMVGASAVGLWELMFKHFLKSKGSSDPVIDAEPKEAA